MRQISRISSLSAFTVLFGLGMFAGCGVATVDETAEAQTQAALAACHLADGTVERNAVLHVCDPQDTKKTTICHLPPGNPANAHTLCIGNPAVAPHLLHHGDYLGPCRAETPCPPPVVGGAGGVAGSGPGGAGGSVGAGGAGGTVVIE
jgi:hypothetical protein